MFEKKAWFNPLVISSVLATGIFLGSTVSPFASMLTVSAEANTSGLQIVSVIDQDNYLLSDGSMWAKSMKGAWHSEYQFAGITAGSNNQYYGWTTTGQAMSWDNITEEIHVIPGMNNVAHISGDGIVLHTDGKVDVIGSGKPDTLPNSVKLIDGFEDSYAILKQSGDILYYKDYQNGLGRKIGSYPDAISIKQDGVAIAVLRSDGTVTLLDLLSGDIPQVIANDAVAIAWQGSKRTLLVVKKDGSVWSHSRSTGFAPQVLSELTDIVQVVYSPTGIYAQHKDGSWVQDTDKIVSPLQVPSITSLKLILSKTNAVVGDKINAKIQEIYSNGSIHTRPASANELKVDLSQIAEILSDGTIKVKAIGNATITLTRDTLTTQSPLNGTTEEALTGAVLIEGSVYLPIQTVFKAMGGTILVNGNQFQINWGTQTIQLNKNSAVAQMNNQPVTMKGKVRTSGSQTVFPATLLSSISKDAKVTWDSKYQQAIVQVNGSNITIQSDKTLKLMKQEEIGHLTRLLGKSYWVNYYHKAGERFSKVNIKDIYAEKDPYNRTRFVVQFRDKKGTEYLSDRLTALEITDLLSDKEQFFNYDIRSKYNWSQATWNRIINAEVVEGMNTQQALLSWGKPDKKTITKENGHTIEIWSYIGENYLNMLGIGDGVVYEVFSI
ncbi:hypothetical protein PaeCFBP13512_05510 [Paenibacillus sp. CFBP13512]|uniref:stalk domain-containing protein n=1 Tax=Paenibacillus sp. CFBP13512 TaxID=2184007 RepID=UPI0010BFD537|nr:stalk domain-containing protein [Paenibacillus sp. CFBP13512]TKJ92811.1 hypothetical protein PaeCFBP13512_05510 [Paenibacillus sp. CFBP13512]